MKILITGGLGYIGSNLTLELLNRNYKVFVLDNLSNSSISVKKKIVKLSKKNFFFKKADCKNKNHVIRIFKKFKPDAVIHLAGLKSVSESMLKPEVYYKENFLSAFTILQAMKKFKVKKMIFSSSATVYGEPKYLPLDEKHKTNPNNPYGLSKLMIEDCFKNFCKFNKDFSIASLRYFNPVGSDKSGILRDNPKFPNNLFPKILNFCSGKIKYLPIYGNNYPTKDGTPVRDYIHILDLVDAHIQMIKFFKKKKFETFNVGTGRGYTVIEIINHFMKKNKIKIKTKIMKKRKGDVVRMYASVKKIYQTIGWKSKYNLDDMCQL